MGSPSVHDLTGALAADAVLGSITAAAVQARTSLGTIPAIASRLGRLGAEVQLVTATDNRATSREFTLTYVFAPPGGAPVATVLAGVAASDLRFPSLATRSFAASRFEREIRDLFGLTPVGHPDPRRLALHQFWPDDYHPLRHDAAPRTEFFDDGRPFPFRRVEGEGLLEITVGPVHAGVIEPGHFRFSVEGETIVNLETRLGFVHKGVEKLFETLPFAKTWPLAERISGDESVAHVVAYCEGLEALAGCTVPRRAGWLRLLLLELERLYNHVGDVGMIVNDTGFAFGHAHCFRIREELFRLNEQLTGHRLMRGAVVPGGIAPHVPAVPLEQIVPRLTALVREFLDVARLSLDNTMVLERLQGTGRLAAKTAREMQVVGLVGRASGVDADARRDAPTGAYREVDVRVVSETTGDVWARTVVRIEEAIESARLIEIAAGRAGGGPTAARLGPMRPGAHATSVVESWRGPVWYWVLADGDRSVARVKPADPSFRNWPALEYAVLDNIVPDFPLCNKSFNLSYSGSDL
jgi:Ni,Fe-hydrogenase III large subunit/Ni,Fe-hydrogenase III component G